MYSQKTFEERMEKTIRAYKDELSHIRAGRANPKLLDDITIEYYGTETPLNQVATVNVPEARMITIQPWDMNNLKAIEKAILASDLGITPSNDGKIIRLPFPPLTEERRKELVKEVKKREEEAKVAMRNVRRDAMDAIKKAEKEKEISEDDRYAKEADLQKLTDKVGKKIEEISEAKEKELMEI
ncbi:MAG: ribosome recycling factor [Peptoniphilaceae bacterium]|nr:ribosome recycling factor [Peptoniphilaceae bacterium]MCI6659629.1 ribosome recycling factor [Peptoniphilaceae bacterium]MDD7433564.1 ribosome recycling factor [Peptoniphilaceae bacterium]MDY3076029.1 ribosome recycling factor [Peptoniphilaceae bacterium]MDY3986603.1 ribosome recycling factor [Peptoniphilaceae bacterium]